MFACCVCSTTHFLDEVVEVGRVAVLATEEGRERYLALPFLRDHLHLFTQLDTAWICITCQASMSAGRLPTLAAVNGLSAPWVRLPSTLIDMSVEEIDLLSLTNVFSVVDGLQVGVVGQGAPSKTVFVPLAGMTSVPRHTDVVRTGEDRLALHTRPPGHLPVISATRVLGVLDRMIATSPRYHTTAAGRRTMLGEMDRVVVGVDREVERQVVQGPNLPMDHFTASGPRLATLYGVVLPWAKPHLSVAAARLLAIPNLAAQLASMFDMDEVAGVEWGLGREVPVSLREYLQHRLSHIHRGGPGSRPGLVLGLLYKYDCQMVQELVRVGRARQAAGQGGGPETWLRRHPGTAAFLTRLGQDLMAALRWRPPAAFWLTFSASSNTSDLLGTWVSHQGGLAREEAQVWQVGDEREFLGGGGGEEEAYYVHQPCQEGMATCHLHPHPCTRTPLEAWRAR